MKFKTEEERKTMQEILREGGNTKFWSIIVEILEESKVDIQIKQDSEELKDLPPEQYKSYNELFKAKKQLIDKLLKTPENIVSWLEKPDNERKNYDPYPEVVGLHQVPTKED